MKVEVRPSTIADLLEYSGELPPIGCRAFTGLIDGRIVAVGGYGYARSGAVIAFLTADDEVRAKAKISLMKTAKRVIEHARSRGIYEINATYSADIPGARKFLERLGFKLISEKERFYRYAVHQS